MSLPWPQEIKESVRNDIPSTSLGWYPQAPNNIGTKKNGLPMIHPAPLPNNIHNMEYRGEDYATNPYYGIVSMFNFEPCRALPLPDVFALGAPGVNQAAAEAKRDAHRQALLDDKNGVIAMKGELIFTHSTGVKPERTLLEKHMRINTPSYDETTIYTEGITIPQLSRYFKAFHVEANPDHFEWSPAAIRRLRNQIHFAGVVDAVGAGETQLVDASQKNYVVIVERMAFFVSDIWPSGFGRQPAGLLYVELTGVPNGANYQNLTLHPLAVMQHNVAINRLNTQQRIDGVDRIILHHWYIGMYRNLSVPGPKHRAPRVSNYVGGDRWGQKELAQCDIVVGL